MEGGRSATVVPTDTTVMEALAAKLRHVASGPQEVTETLKAAAPVTTVHHHPTMIRSPVPQARTQAQTQHHAQRLVKATTVMVVDNPCVLMASTLHPV